MEYLDDPRFFDLDYDFVKKKIVKSEVIDLAIHSRTYHTMHLILGKSFQCFNPVLIGIQKQMIPY